MNRYALSEALGAHRGALAAHPAFVAGREACFAEGISHKDSCMRVLNAWARGEETGYCLEQREDGSAYINISNPQPVRSQNGNMFVFSGYWRRWARVLHESTPRDLPNCPHSTVEVDLEVVMNIPSMWDRVNAINIRNHCTTRTQGDVFSGSIPGKVHEHMRAYMTETTVNRLLHEDFLPNINWDIYRQHSNGGAPFELVKKV